jgi:metallo-beta-lactamase family protein
VRSQAPSLAFHGGVGTVTGSRFLLDAGASRVLVDAGMFQGEKSLRLRNWDQPGFDPASVDHVLLTHAHIDHSGCLPRFVRDGLRCPVHCTAATRELSALLLSDAARLQEEDAEYANEKGYSRHHPALPLYTLRDAEAAFRLMQPVAYDRWLTLGEGIRGRFLSAGHILGAAMVEVRVAGGARELRIVFSGDVGRYGVPLHADPDPLPDCDVLVIESTYGDREHAEASVAEQIGAAVQATLAEGGSVLVPAFAVGRAQLVTLSLRALMESGDLPDVPIHIDSPMAVDATRLYAEYAQDRSLDSRGTAAGPLFPRKVRFHRTIEESKALNRLPGPRIIVSASGMLAGGRVLHHLKRLVGEPKNLIMLVGYQAAGTRGRALLEGAGEVRMHGESFAVRARVVALGGLSAHADRAELLRWVGTAATPPRRIFVTHGEPGPARALADALSRALGARCEIPELGQVCQLD